MSIVTLINKKVQPSIGLVAIDCVVDEVHSYENEITQFPIEDGSQIIDHARPLPVRLRLSGIFSDTPVRIGGTRDLTPFIARENGTGKSVVQFNELVKYAGFSTEGNREALKNTFQLVTVVTGLRVYENMAIASVMWPRNSGTGRSLRFSIELIEVKKARISFVDLPAVADVNGQDPNIQSKAESKADQGTTETEDPTPSGSLLYEGGRSLLKGIGSLTNPKLDILASGVPTA